MKDCISCGKGFLPQNGVHKLCGSWRRQVGCSWKAEKLRRTNKEKQRKYRTYVQRHCIVCNRNLAKTRQRKFCKKCKPDKYKKIERYCSICKLQIKDKGRNYCIDCRNKKHFGTRELRKRFKVFNRDGFRCVYCGRSSKEAVLQIDHLFPKAKGGKNNIGNLVTACSECNLGKSDFILTESPAE